MGAISDVDLTVAGLDSEAAYRRINQLRFLAHVQQRWLEQKTLARRFRQDVAAWRDKVNRPALAAAREELRRRHAEEYVELLREASTVVNADRSAPAPSAVFEPSTAPQAAQVLVERLTGAGWVTRLDCGQTKDGKLQARVDATRGSARLRVAYRRKNAGRGSSKGWGSTFVGVQAQGLGWVSLPKVADAIDLALLAEDEFLDRVAGYATAQAPTQSIHT